MTTTNEIDLIVEGIRRSAMLYTSEELDTERLSNLLFNRLVGNGVSTRIISYTYNNKPFFSVQYYKNGEWHNFPYTGLDMSFQPVYSRTLNPQNIIKVEMVPLG